MRITKIQGLNFRNYSELNLPVENMINVFYGQNAQGKTNILESIFYAAFGLSHRTNQEENLFKFSENQMMVSVNFENKDDIHFVRIKKFPLANERIKKEIILDDVKVPAREHYGVLNVVMFSPEDLQFVKGEPSLRRRFLDMQISQTNRSYLDLLMQYGKVLRQRNGLLKQIRDGECSEDVLDTWDNEFVRLSTAICEARKPAIEKLQNISGEIHKEISNGESLKIHYVLKGLHREILDGVEEYQKFFEQEVKACRQLDIIRGITNIGPHRDDLLLEINDKSLKNFGSQGQQRSAALALKLSQLEYVKQEIEEYPVLLLDDVMSELDESRRAQLLKFIDGRVQTFITVNDRELIPNVVNGAYYKIENGTVNKV